MVGRDTPDAFAKAGWLQPSKARAALICIAVSMMIDASAKPHRRWLYLNRKIERLQKRWAKLETWLVRKHRWFELTPAEQQALPWAQELRDIDGCLELLFEQLEAVGETLPAQGATTLEAVAAKLAVVERLVEHDDHPEAHAMIAGALQDLLALMERA
jgi:hypothetical protein